MAHSVSRSIRAIRCVFLGAAAVLLAGMSPVGAQTDYPTATLKAYVEAALKIEAMMGERDAAMSQAETEEEADAIHAQSNADMKVAIEQTPGITPEEYLEINRTLQKDPELMLRIIDKYGKAFPVEQSSE